MLNSKWWRLIFCLAFAISIAHFITLHSRGTINPAHNQSSLHNEQLSNSDFIAGGQASINSKLSSDEEVDEEDDDCLPDVPLSFSAVHSPYKLSFTIPPPCSSPSGKLPVVL